MQEPCETINKDVPQQTHTATTIAYIPTPAECATIQTTPSTATQEQHTKGETLTV